MHACERVCVRVCIQPLTYVREPNINWNLCIVNYVYMSFTGEGYGADFTVDNAGSILQLSTIGRRVSPTASVTVNIFDDNIGLEAMENFTLIIRLVAVGTSKMIVVDRLLVFIKDTNRECLYICLSVCLSSVTSVARLCFCQ